MNRNQLKLFACLTMLADHVGYLLLPGLPVLRYIGRLAMPLFAFFIGEGCLHTSNRRKYLLSLAVLGTGCQAVYVVEELLVTKRFTLSSDCWYFNILFTFCFAAVGCFLLTDLVEKIRAKTASPRRFVPLAAFLAVFSAVTFFNWKMRKNGASFYFDYGMCGILLPMSAALFRDRKKKLAAFSVMLVIYCFVFFRDITYVWFALADIPLLLLYNGKPGSRRFKYFFYVFYPAHLAALYLIGMLTG